jgi:hypothetical protein
MYKRDKELTFDDDGIKSEGLTPLRKRHASQFCNSLMA